jgi:hypothetical protein
MNSTVLAEATSVKLSTKAGIPGRIEAVLNQHAGQSESLRQKGKEVVDQSLSGSSAEYVQLRQYLAGE